MTGALATAEDTVRTAIEALDLEAARNQFREQGDFIYLERFLPPDLVAGMVEEVRALAPSVHRAWVPFVRKAGSVGQAAIAERAPLLFSLYHSPSLLAFAKRLSEVDLELKDERDIHACALYYYQRKGDHIGWHYDHCGCERGTSFTLTLGLVDRSSMKCEFELFRRDKGVPRRRLTLTTPPGSLIFFCGSRPYHKVTKLGRHEERVIYSFNYVRKGYRASGFSAFIQSVLDAVIYFGPGALFWGEPASQIVARSTAKNEARNTTVSKA